MKVRSVNSKGVMSANITSLGKRGNRATGYNPETGEFILAYFKSNGGLYLARIDQALKPAGTDFLASCQIDKRIAVEAINIVFNDLKNEFFVNWSYIDVSPRSWDIYGQRIRGTSIRNSCSNPMNATNRQNLWDKCRFSSISKHLIDSSIDMRPLLKEETMLPEINSAKYFNYLDLDLQNFSF